MFVRVKTVKGAQYHYLVESVRIKRKVRQVILAYLGAFDNVEDAYVSASGKRRAKLSRYRRVEDINNDQVLRDAERRYHRERMGVDAPASAVRLLLPNLPKVPKLPRALSFGQRVRRRRVRRSYAAPDAIYPVNSTFYRCTTL